MHIALDFHSEVLSGEHQAGFSIPVVKPPVFGLWIECASSMLIKAHHKSHIILAGFNGRVGGIQGAATGRTTVPDIGELQAR